MQPPLSRTLHDLLRENAVNNPDAVAVDTLEKRMTFAALNERSRQLADAMGRYDISPGGRIGLLAGNTIEWLETLFAASAVGATVVPFSTWSTAQELEFLLADSDIDLLFTVAYMGDRCFTDDIGSLAATRALRVVVIGDFDENAQSDYRHYASLFANASGADAAPEIEVNAANDALVLYTSGSTSHPKGVRLKHHGVVENGFNIGERQGLQNGDIVFLPTPLFWSYGIANALPAAFTHGAGLALMERFEPAGALNLIERSQCASIYTLPSITSALLQCEAFAPERTASLRTGMTIGARKDFLQAAERLRIPELCNVYGATEVYGNCTVSDHRWPLARRARSQGEPLPGVTLRIRDPDGGRELAAGDVGLVEVQGYVTPGYTGQSAELNKTAFTEDGFYRTGDLGYIDDEGGFVFVARNTDMIKRNGINVSPAEVEEVLLELAKISAVAVVGATQAEVGEAIVAFVVGEPEKTPTVEEIRAYCRQVMSKYKIPDYIEVCAALPLTATGKLQRNRLKERAVELIGDVTKARVQ